MPTYTFHFSGGVNAVDGWGQRDQAKFIGTWAIDDRWSLKFTSTVGDFTLGVGNLTGGTYQFMMTYANRVYLANGANWNFSAIDDPVGWEEQNIGAGSVSYRSSIGYVDSTLAFGVVQGRLAVFGRQSIQIWSVNADPGLFKREQILANIGTVAPNSVQGIGELDVMFLDDTGIRSLRSKEVTLNAYVADLGSPIDSIVQTNLRGLSAAQKASAVSVVEPTNKRYWLYLNGVIYVLSNFPLSKVTAWSTYLATYETTFGSGSFSGSVGVGTGNLAITGLTIGAKYEWTPGNSVSITSAGGTTLTSAGEFIPTAMSATVVGPAGVVYTGTLKGQVAFTPERMVVYNGLIYIRSTAGDLLVYGGLNNNTFDSAVPTVELPWLDMQTPTLVKQGQGLDIAMKGKWKVMCSMNPRATSLTEIVNRGGITSGSVDIEEDSTFDVGHFGYSANGTHFKLKFVGSAASTEQKVAKVSLIYDKANRK